MALAPGTIFFSGDSITVGANCSGVGDYPNKTIELLNARDGSGWSGTRNGHGGYSTWDGAAVIDSDISGMGSVDYIFLYWGANDAYPNDHLGDYTPLGAGDETSWKAAYTYIIEACHTKWANAHIWIGKSYRCNSLGAPDGFLTNYVFPWTDDLVSSFSYVSAGINGAEILQAGYPESMGDPPHSVHPACYGHLLLAEGIRDEMFPLGGVKRHQLMTGGMQALSGGFNG